MLTTILVRQLNPNPHIHQLNPNATRNAAGRAGGGARGAGGGARPAAGTRPYRTESFYH